MIACGYTALNRDITPLIPYQRIKSAAKHAELRLHQIKVPASLRCVLPIHQEGRLLARDDVPELNIAMATSKPRVSTKQAFTRRTYSCLAPQVSVCLAPTVGDEASN